MGAAAASRRNGVCVWGGVGTGREARRRWGGERAGRVLRVWASVVGVGGWVAGSGARAGVQGGWLGWGWSWGGAQRRSCPELRRARRAPASQLDRHLGEDALAVGRAPQRRQVRPDVLHQAAVQLARGDGERALHDVVGIGVLRRREGRKEGEGRGGLARSTAGWRVGTSSSERRAAIRRHLQRQQGRACRRRARWGEVMSSATTASRCSFRPAPPSLRHFSTTLELRGGGSRGGGGRQGELRVGQGGRQPQRGTWHKQRTRSSTGSGCPRFASSLPPSSLPLLLHPLSPRT